MIERIRYPLYNNPNHITYSTYTKTMHIQDIIHQIEMAGYKGKSNELNLYFRNILESILLHIDNNGKHNKKYQELIQED